jgi:hypothetical protein
MALFLFFTKFSIFFTQSENYTADVKMNFILLPNIKMEKKTQTMQEQQEYVDTPLHCSEKLDQDKMPEKELAQTLVDQEKTTSEDVETLYEARESDSERADELSESLVE